MGSGGFVRWRRDTVLASNPPPANLAGVDGCSIYLGGGVADTRAMRQDRHEIARSLIIHAELLVNIANRVLGDEAPNSEQDHELTVDVYKLARGCEALNDTLAAADNLRKGLGI